MEDCQIKFSDLAVPDLLVEDAQGLGIFGGQDDPAGIAVDAVAQGGGEGVLVPGVPLLFLIKVGLDMGDQGVDLFLFVGVAQQARPFVEQQQVFILIHDVQPGLEDREKGVVLPGGVKKLIVDV